MAILFEPDPTAVELMRLAIGPGVEVVSGVVALRQRVADDAAHNLVVIGADVDLDAALQFAATMRVSRPTLGVLLVRRRLDTTVLTQALRAGVREVVAVDDLTALREACRRSEALTEQFRGVALADPGQPTRVHGQVVTVFAAKGGCGKTTVATNLAATVAASGARRVCLVDLDLAFGDIAIAMQLFPTRTIADAVGLTRLDETAVRSLLTTHSSGVETLVAPTEPGAAESIPGSLVSELLAVLKTMFDVVVVDTPPAFTDHVLAAFDLSEHLILLATLDIPALKNLKLTLETLDMLGYSRERWHVLLNRADSKVGLTVHDVEKTLNTTISCELPSSRAVPASINRGVPIVVDDPGHPVSQALRKFADASLFARPTSGPRRRAERRGFTLSRRGGSS